MKNVHRASTFKARAGLGAELNANRLQIGMMGGGGGGGGVGGAHPNERFSRLGCVRKR